MYLVWLTIKNFTQFTLSMEASLQWKEAFEYPQTEGGILRGRAFVSTRFETDERVLRLQNFGPPGIIVDLVEFSLKENQHASQRNLPTIIPHETYSS
jgi:hypothetical protein